MSSVSLPNTIQNGQALDALPVMGNFQALQAFINQQTVHTDGSNAMTGQLALPGDPTQAAHAARKAYVDQAAAQAIATAGYVGTAQLADLAVTTGKIADGNVSTSKLTFGAVGTNQLANNAVDTNKILNDSVTAPKIASNAIITSKIADGNVSTSKLTFGAVGTNQIASGAVDADKIANGNVTMNKLGNTAGGPFIQGASTVVTTFTDNGVAGSFDISFFESFPSGPVISMVNGDANSGFNLYAVQSKSGTGFRGMVLKLVWRNAIDPGGVGGFVGQAVADGTQIRVEWLAVHG
jgi:hypothetical protein